MDAEHLPAFKDVVLSITGAIQGFAKMDEGTKELVVNMSAFAIIKEYESGFAANFWQVIARLFDQDLKARYDPKGRDARIEELVQIWDSGQWDQFYYSVFFEAPKKTVIKSDRLKSVVKKKG